MDNMHTFALHPNILTSKDFVLLFKVCSPSMPFGIIIYIYLFIKIINYEFILLAHEST